MRGRGGDRDSCQGLSRFAGARARVFGLLAIAASRTVVHALGEARPLGLEISVIIHERRFLNPKALVPRVAGFDIPMAYAKLELEYLPDAQRIAEAVTQCLAN